MSSGVAPARGLRPALVGVFAGAALGLLVTAAAPRAVEAGQLPTDPKGLYEIGCASCHGVDGEGVDPSRVAFDLPLPDFTDCEFAVREPDGDWLAVAHSGGPVRGFSRVMPAFGEAFDDEQLQKILDHVRTFCGDDDWPRGELNLPRPLFTEKAFPEDEAVWTTEVAVEGGGAVGTEVLYEKRFGARSMIEVSLPLQVRETAADGSWSGGVGDLGLGVKHTFHHDLEAGTILAVGGEVLLPTGDEDRGLGAGVTRFEPYLAWGQILPGDAFVQAQGGLELSTDTDRREHEAFWRATVGRTWTRGRFGRAWSPMVELLGARELADGAGIEWSLVPQTQVTLNTRQHVMLNLGVQLPLNEAERRSTRLLVYLLWDWFDGGLFDGW